MSHTDTLFSSRGLLAGFSREMKCPYGTIWSWKAKGSIPVWRRREVLDAARRLDLDLPLETIGYLTQAA